MILHQLLSAHEQMVSPYPPHPEVQAARSELAQAWQNFHQAEPAFVDAAIYQLTAAEQKYRALLRHAKGVSA
ncbi:DUF2508 family protein [Paenibacillus naphthalenovorans]|uniref:DUF2508 family protein n=1 Tax=Paenibacillus naphthalenovorans TaxID=162209 RepID=UPI00089136C8|nr:DUF2508 family protein [Paenibacillus naphthalenovorans]SDI49777.1 Protein of unknown function [Paenibacillus naphthalenovorans]